jgi:uncharacterized membrane protein
VRRRPRGDEGSILLLVLGCVTIALLLVVVVVDASAVYLARRSLASDVDGAALSAAQAVSAGSVYADGAGAQLPLDAVEAAVARYGAGDEAALAGSVARGPGGDAVIVTGRKPVRLPFAAALGIGPVTVTATARASSVRLAE